MKPNIIERAYQLAPHCSRTNELRQILRSEGYMQVDAHMSGLGLQRELDRRQATHTLTRPGITHQTIRHLWVGGTCRDKASVRRARCQN